MKEKFFIERTNKDGSYEIVGRYTNYEEALIKLKKIDSKLHHGIWTYNWVNTVFGYRPITWIN